VIQEHIKQPLAEEVLFGKLKKGGVVKVTVKEDGSGLNLEALEDGPVTPKPEPLPKKKRAAPRRRRPPAESALRKPPPDKPSGDGGKRGLVPKVPLKTN
jgi:ATP-dependent Clp protease ATP-binding subunit ClpA